MAMEEFRAPALPYPPSDYQARYFAELTRALRIYFNQLDSETPNKAYSYRADKLLLNLTNNIVEEEGAMSWNPVDQTVNLGMAYGVTQQVGQETYARVANQTGVLIPNGAVVGFAGATPTAILVSPYLADGSQPTLYALGVMTHDLPDSGQKGYCTTWGFVRDLDTSAFAAGDVLYASPTVAGAFTNVKPTAPDNVIPLAVCVVADATAGVVFVRPTIQQMQYYGAFASTTDHVAVAINTPTAVTFNATDISNGVVIGTPASRLVVPQSGLFTVNANFQLSSNSASAKTMRYWFRKNGVDLPNSALLVTSDINNGYSFAGHSYTVSMQAGDYVEVLFAVDDVALFLRAAPATGYAPASPSVQCYMTQAQQ
jgi:hypothetical protein